MQPSSQPLAVLDAKYQLVRKLGEGGMGAVYEGLHLGTGRRIAVKVIASEGLAKKKELVERFQREAMASGKIESQYIAQVLDTGVDPTSGSPYMVMELLTGEDIEQAIKRLGPLPPDLALRLAAHACLGLQKAHEKGVVHRDIKPANIFLAQRDGGEIVAKLLDFGIAKIKQDQTGTEGKELTRTGTMLGSPLYMSPEQAFGKKTIDHRTDLWSLGVVLYEALTGRTPHAHAETIGELIICICQQPPRPLQDHAPWVAPEVAAIVHKALALDPDARFASAKDMFAAVRTQLPGGHGVDESMFAPLPAHARMVIAPKLYVSSDVRAPSPSMGEVAMQGAPAVTARTTAGLEQAGAGSSSGAAEKRRRVPAAIAGGVVVAAVAVVGVLLVGREHSQAPAAAAPAILVAPAAAISASPPLPTAPTPPPVAAPAPEPTAPSVAGSTTKPAAPGAAPPKRAPSSPAKPPASSPAPTTAPSAAPPKPSAAPAPPAATIDPSSVR